MYNLIEQELAEARVTVLYTGMRVGMNHRRFRPDSAERVSRLPLEPGATTHILVAVLGEAEGREGAGL